MPKSWFYPFPSKPSVNIFLLFVFQRVFVANHELGGRVFFFN